MSIKKSKPIGKHIIAVFIIAGVIFIAAISALFLVFSKDEIVASVNGSPIYVDELIMYAEDMRNAVAAEISKENGISEMGTSFWSTEYNGKTPNQELYSRALNAAISDKLLQLEAVRLEIVAPLDFKEMIKAYKEFNKNRASTAEVVYGPKSYELQQYFQGLMSTMQDDLKTALLLGELAPTEEQLREAFDKVPDEYKQTDFKAEGLLIAFEGDESPLPEILALTQNGETVSEAAKALSLLATPFEFDTTQVHREDTAAITVASDLAAIGEDAFLLDMQNKNIYYIEKKTGGELLTFEQAPRFAQTMYIDKALSELMDKRYTNADMQINETASAEFLKRVSN